VSRPGTRTRLRAYAASAAAPTVHSMVHSDSTNEFHSDGMASGLAKT
jgi:hypothetical protein